MRAIVFDFFGFLERIVGRHGGTRETRRAIARRCGAEPTDAELDAAVAAQLAGPSGFGRPGPASWRCSTGCAPTDSGSVWSATARASSASPGRPRPTRPVSTWRCSPGTRGYRKPDLRLYAAVSARLGVSADDCWYVGDGGSREHDGARRAGMRPIVVTNEAYPGAAAYRSDPDPYRPDLAVADLDELPALLNL